jgi:hypothetical protein
MGSEYSSDYIGDGPKGQGSKSAQVRIRLKDQQKHAEEAVIQLFEVRVMGVANKVRPALLSTTALKAMFSSRDGGVTTRTRQAPTPDRLMNESGRHMQYYLDHPGGDKNFEVLLGSTCSNVTGSLTQHGLFAYPAFGRVSRWDMVASRMFMKGGFPICAVWFLPLPRMIT